MFVSKVPLFPCLLALSCAYASQVRAAPDCEVVTLPAHGADAQLTDLLDDGRMVGATVVPDGAPSPYWRAALWVDHQLVDLPPLAPGASAYAMAINAHGTVLGSAEDADGVSHVVVWNHGQIARVPAFDYEPDGSEPSPHHAIARDLNERGQFIADIGYARRCLLWNDATSVPVDITPERARGCRALDINDHGDVLMSVPWDYFVRRRDGSYTRIDLSENARLIRFGLMNNAGTVVASHDEEQVSFVWQPAAPARTDDLRKGFALALTEDGTYAIWERDVGDPRGEGVVALVAPDGRRRLLGAMEDFNPLFRLRDDWSVSEPTPLFRLNARGELAWTHHDITHRPRNSPLVRRSAHVCTLR